MHRSNQSNLMHFELTDCIKTGMHQYQPKNKHVSAHKLLYLLKNVHCSTATTASDDEVDVEDGEGEGNIDKAWVKFWIL